MERIRAYLTQRLGPLPIWAWALIGLMAILAYWYFSRSGVLSGAAAPSNQTGTGNALANLLGGGGGGIVPPPPTSSDQLAGNTPTSYYGSYAGITDVSSGVGSGYQGSSTAGLLGPGTTLDGGPSGGSTIQNTAALAPIGGANTSTVGRNTGSWITGPSQALLNVLQAPPPTSSGRTGAQSY